MNEIKPNVGKHGNEMFMKDSVNKITEDAGSLPRENYIQMNKEITNIDTLKNEKFNEEIQKKIKPNTSLREQPSSLILNISTYGDVKNDNSNNNNNNSAKISKLTNKDTNIKMDAMQNERRGNRIPTNNSSDFVSTKMQHLPSKGDTSNEKNEYPIDKKEHKIDCIDSKGSNHEYMSNKHGDTNVKDSHTDSKQEHMNSKCGYINTKDNRANSKHNPINNKPNRINLNMRNINKQTDTECRKGYDDKMRNGIKHAKIEKKTGAILHKNNKIKSSGILGSELISKDNKINNNEIKNKKNPYDVSNEKKLKILEKRVRCLNTYYNRKDMGSCSLNSSVQYNDGNINGNENSIKKNVLLLLTRDFRIADNWSIIYAYDMAKKNKCNLLACTYINRKEKFTERYINIKLKVLKNLEEEFKKLNIPFYVIPIFMIDEFMEFLRIHEIKTVVCDFHSLGYQKQFVENLVQMSNKKKIKILQVDSHNIIPLWITSKMEESSIRTIKPKIQTHLSSFLIEYIKLERFDQIIKYPEPFDIVSLYKKLTVNNSCSVLSNFVCTEKKAREILEDFCKNKLDKYSVKRNDPNYDTINLLIPYINLGIISSQRCILEVNKYALQFPSIHASSGKEYFNDDLLIKKELADNFCFYNKNYDNFNGAKDWAKESLKKHELDKRNHLYDYEDFRNARTHNDIWNCCQLQLINEGTIHEFLRMYWAKKILNWSENSRTALKCAIKLTNEFSIDGKTANAYVSIMSSIMGVHDQSWNERSVFGKIRYMDYNSCKRNFDINLYMSKYPKGKENALIVQKIPTMTFSSYIKKRKNSELMPIQENKNEKVQKKKASMSGGNDTEAKSGTKLK
ncbi:DNA photolyase [Plasmodium yoelii]|uniref:Deoxyribodipyrimidine photo-lyase n=3 Tax=Plasmodium yoelii TaxID=5861 RepID=A0AAE9WU39_PLAYO|nr:DNA photolyase [Plasmodium yoelii]EAA22315.1 FAD binding domain of DNA photolyase, putative [Plasmodium yoelii yoelii]WBY58524.1 deoxyribodipyrimidine photo-lyase [Plasmodium yoelii yoelii]CDU18836.1 deoxyribodipyrimidine photo-lyase, putative [Plasmodium yoelii]VTZ79421.1 deoxyribodipyrimidine photo-lyase, putative [Plasmodium yoelii]|eukprot:XP_730750.1 DNA photolyase [Plasmodium yoelii]